jgi:hypothetical protein
MYHPRKADFTTSHSAYNKTRKLTLGSEAIFFPWTLSIILILTRYYVSKSDCGSVFRDFKAPNLVDPLDTAILSHWAQRRTKAVPKSILLLLKILHVQTN